MSRESFFVNLFYNPVVLRQLVKKQRLEKASPRKDSINATFVHWCVSELLGNGIVHSKCEICGLCMKFVAGGLSIQYRSVTPSRI